MNNINILEEKEKKAIDNLIMLKYFTMEKEDKESIDIILKLVESLIAENKELKDSNIELATTIDALHTDISELKTENKELDKFIKEGITIEPNNPYENFQLNYLRENFISKSKVEELLKKYKYTEIEDSEKIIQFYKDLLSLLGKE